MDLLVLPTLNACLNTTSAVLLILGYTAIRKKDIRRHKRCMIGALAASTLFLISYLTFHYLHGHTRFPGQGAVRAFYFMLLISHTVLAVVNVPLVILTLACALKGRIPLHKRLARITLPVWLYVSVTGVLVYVMLYRL